MIFSLNELLIQVGRDPLPSDFLVKEPLGLLAVAVVGISLGMLRTISGFFGLAVLFGRAIAAGDGQEAIIALQELAGAGNVPGNRLERRPAETRGKKAMKMMCKVLWRVFRAGVALFVAGVSFVYLWISLTCPQFGVWATRFFLIETFVGIVGKWGYNYRRNINYYNARDLDQEIKPANQGEEGLQPIAAAAAENVDLEDGVAQNI